MQKYFILLAILIFSWPLVLYGSEVPQFTSLFCDNIVLQRDKPIAIEVHTGGASHSESLKLSVQLGEHIAPLQRVDDRYIAMLPKLPASKQPKTLNLLKAGKVIGVPIENVLIGDVWLAAGQSNMQWQIKQVKKHLPEIQEWIDTANYPTIRVRRIDNSVSGSRAEKAHLFKAGSCTVMKPESVGEFSCVAAAYARELSDELDIPIGIVDVSWGGKPIEPFIPLDQYVDQPILKDILKLSNQEQLDVLADMEGGVVIRNPEGYPAAIYNARVAPLVEVLSFKGVIWYQGESNAGKGEDPRWYRNKMAALIKGWRTEFDSDKMPFYIVQLPSYGDATGWIRMREEQRLAAQSIANVGMITIIDLPGKNIHPPHKLPVAERLAKLALSDVYGKRSIVGQAAEVQQIRFQDGAAIIDWNHVSSKGLAVGNWQKQVPLDANSINKLKWFEVASESGQWFPANVELGVNKTQMIVRSAKCSDPKAVRYACVDEVTDGLLYSSDNLPVSPFCSQLDWLPWQDNVDTAN